MGLINQISVLFLLIITGFVIRKKNIVSRSFQKELSTLVLHVTLPAFIISSMNFTFSEEVLKDIGMILVISFATYIIALLLSYPITKLLGVSGKKRDIYQYLCIFANVGFMGYPVLELIAGKQAVFYGAIYNLPFNLFVWTIGISIMMRHKNEEEKVHPLKNIVNPGFIAVMIGFFFYLTPFSIPTAINDTLAMIGKTTTPLSMMFIGFVLSELTLKEFKGDMKEYLLIAYRLVITPLLSFSILYTLGFRGLLLIVPVVLAGMPAAANTAIFAARCDNDAKLASKMIFVSTLLSMLTIPILMQLLNYFK